MARIRTQLLATGATEVSLLALSILTGILSARLLGPAGRGELAIVILWPSILAAIGSVGVREALVFYQARHAHSSARLAGTGIILAAVQSVVLIAVGFVIIPWLTQAQSVHVTRLGQVYLLSIPLSLLGWYFAGLLQGSLDILRFNAVRLSVHIVYLIALVYLWLAGSASVQTVSAGLLLANLCTASLGLFLSLSRFGVDWAVDLKLLRDITSYGLRNHVGSIANLFNQRADQMVMSVLLSPQELGWYAVAVSVSGLTRVASGAFATVAFPGVANADLEGQRILLSRLSRSTTTATVVVGLVLMLSIPVLIPLVYSPAYAPSILPAEILVVATMFLSLGCVWGDGLRGMGHPLKPTYAELWSLAVTAVGLFLLVPVLGIVGAALVSVLAYFSSSAYLYVQLRRLLALGLGEVLRPVPLSWLLPGKRPARFEGGSDPDGA